MARQLRRQPIDPGSPRLRRRRPAMPVPRHRSIWRPTSQRDKPRLHPAGPPVSPGAAWIRTPPGTGELRPRSIHSRYGRDELRAPVPLDPDASGPPGSLDLPTYRHRRRTSDCCQLGQRKLGARVSQKDRQNLGLGSAAQNREEWRSRSR